MKIDFSIPENFLSLIKKDQEITVTIDAFPKETFKGIVTGIDPKIDEKSHNLVIYATIENQRRQLRPGLFVKISLTLGQKTNILLIPEQAALPRQDGIYVYLVEQGVDQGKVKKIKVETGQRHNGKIEVLSGLKEGEIIIVGGQEKTDDEELVKIANDEEIQ